MGFTPNGWLIVVCPHAEHVYILEAVFGHGKQSQTNRLQQTWHLSRKVHLYW